MDIKKTIIKLGPIIGLFIGLFISVSMFYTVAVSPLHNVKDIEYNSNYSVNIEDQYTVSIFIDETNIDSMYVDYYENFHRLTYFIDDAEFNVLLIVKNDENIQDGYEVFVTHDDGGYDIENYHGVFTIRFDEADIYNFSLVTYDTFGTTFHMVSTNVVEARVKIIISLVVGVVSLFTSILLLYKVLKNPKRDA